MNSPDNRQFDLEKYNYLLNGLECIELKLSELKLENHEIRIDSEFFQKEYIKLYEKLNNSVELGDIVYMSDVSSNGSFSKVKNILSDVNEKVIPYIRSSNVGETFIDLENTNKISKESHEQLKLSQTKKLDVIMARKGKIGGASIVLDNEINCNCNENVIKLSINDKEKYNPYYMLAFLNSKYGLKQTERISTGNVQPWISIYQIRKMKLVELSNIFQLKIEEIIKKAYTLRNNNKREYDLAENLLKEKLGLKYIDEVKQNKTEKNFLDTFVKYGRIDSEFFEKKYEILDQCLSNQNSKKLSDIVNIKKSIEPGSDAYISNGVPFIRISNFSKYGIKDTDIYLDEKKYELEKLKPKKNTILLSKDGTIGIAYKVEEDLNIITSGAIIHLILKDSELDIDYLTLVLNSDIVKMQAERSSGGSIIKHWRSEDIKNVKVPVLPSQIQNEISSKVKKSFLMRKESERLINLASKSIEIAIEVSESEALEYLEKNISEI